MSIDELDELMTAGQLADHLDVHESTIHQWVKRGALVAAGKIENPTPGRKRGTALYDRTQAEAVADRASDLDATPADPDFETILSEAAAADADELADFTAARPCPSCKVGPVVQRIVTYPHRPRCRLANLGRTFADEFELEDAMGDGSFVLAGLEDRT